MVSGIVASLTLAGIKSVDHAVKKKSMLNVDEYVSSLNLRSIAFIIFSIYLVISNNLYLPTNDTYWISLFIAVILYSLHTILLMRGYKYADTGVVSSLLGFSPVAVAIPSWIILDETPTRIAIIGIVLCSVGAYTLELQEASLSNPLAPIRKLIQNKGARYIFLDLLIIAVLPSIDKLGLQHSTPLFWVFSTHAGVTLIFLLLIGKLSPNWKSQTKQHSRILLILGLLHTGIWVAQVYAYSLMNVAYVTAIKKLSIVGGIILGYYYMGEKNIKRRLSGGVIILIGVALIILGG